MLKDIAKKGYLTIFTKLLRKEKKVATLPKRTETITWALSDLALGIRHNDNSQSLKSFPTILSHVIPSCTSCFSKPQREARLGFLK